MNGFRAAILAALVLWGWGCAGWAGDVTLTSRDGRITLSGNLLAYDGEFYRVDTIYGELTVDGGAVTCSGPGCPDLAALVAELRIAGERRPGAVLLPALIEAFAARSGYRTALEVRSDSDFTYTLLERGNGQAAARFHFRLDTTGQGLARLLAGEADLALAAREPTQDEVAAHRAAGRGDLLAARRSLIVALDAIVPVVAPGNPVRQISAEDLSAVLAGEISDWADLGWPGGPIRLHLPAPDTGLAQFLAWRIPAAAAPPPETPLHADEDELADAVARDPLALGLVSLSQRGNAVALALSGRCGFAMEAGADSIKSEDYPLTMQLFAYLRPERLPRIMRDFLRFLRSPAAQPIVRRAGYVDLGHQEIGLEQHGARLANAIAAAGEETTLSELQRLVWMMRGNRRLTLAFRFRDGAVELDPQSRSNVELMADLLETGAFDDQRLVFVGFSDGQGPARANLALSRRRAEVVRDAVLGAAPLADRTRFSTTVDAFGEAMPLACDENAWGRAANRRVEVWVGQR